MDALEVDTRYGCVIQMMQVLKVLPFLTYGIPSFHFCHLGASSIQKLTQKLRMRDQNLEMTVDKPNYTPALIDVSGVVTEGFATE